jgi:hypothetical protein
MIIIRLKVKNGKATFNYINNETLLRATTDIVLMGALIAPISVQAADTKIDTALRPLINTIRDLAKPICYGSMLWGWSKVMLGQKSAGYKQLKEAIGGFIGVQFTPAIFDMLSKIGR